MSKAKSLTLAQQKGALAAVSSRPTGLMDSVALRLSFEAGLRVAEVAGLTWADVSDAEGIMGGSITVRRQVAKGGKEREIPMTPNLLAALAAWRKATDNSAPSDRIIRQRNGSNVSANTLAVWFKRLYTSLGFDGVSSHSGRRTFITRAARNVGAKTGTSLFDVMRLAGHSSLTITQRYVEANEAGQRALVNVLADELA
jgi:integrase/recombinase XerD